jgi:hypothetical protein
MSFDLTAHCMSHFCKTYGRCSDYNMQYIVDISIFFKNFAMQIDNMCCLQNLFEKSVFRNMYIIVRVWVIKLLTLAAKILGTIWLIVCDESSTVRSVIINHKYFKKTTVNHYITVGMLHIRHLCLVQTVIFFLFFSRNRHIL